MEIFHHIRLYTKIKETKLVNESDIADFVKKKRILIKNLLQIKENM